jgi:cytosine/adenosine deaminase-related metal-dependent hydrolase
MYISDLFIPGKEGRYSLLIEKDKIATVGASVSPAVSPSLRTGINISIPGAIAFPGLINSHDHLDFNLFPLLGNRIYNNYTAWGRDIHAKNAAEIAAVLRVPQPLRTRWGLYKNLLNGFTTVVNHGEKLETGKELISVLQDCNTLHSVGFEKNWRWKLNRPRRGGLSSSRAPASGSMSGPVPFVLHVGEGTDAAAHREIDRLIRWNLFKKPLIGVHGVAMDEQQAEHFKALVWCPDSNYFLLGRTAPVDRLKNRVSLLFGTDSTLTSGWNSWDQVRLARKEGKVSDEELLEMLTRTAAAVWGLQDRGEIAAGQRADLVIAKGDFFSLNPQDLLLVLHKGQIRLFDESLFAVLAAGGIDTSKFHKMIIHGRGKYTEGDLPGLMNEIRHYHPSAAFPPGYTAG